VPDSGLHDRLERLFIEGPCPLYAFLQFG